MSAAGPANVQRTQIVVQWLIDKHRSAATAELDLQDIWSAEDTLDAESAGLFEVDGHDSGAGTANVFLFAAEPEAAVARIVGIFEKGQLRAGMRIGVAQYTNPERTDWVYRPAYPPGLEQFRIAY